MDGDGNEKTDKNRYQYKHVELQATLLERRKETGTYLQTDSVDEEHEAELTHEMQQFNIEIQIEITKDDTNYQYPHQS